MLADLAVLIGRFQPFHTGHAALLRMALEKSEQVVLVLGSSYHARNTKNPFSWRERAAMIAATLDQSSRARVQFVAIRDYYDETRWAQAVRTAVQQRFPAARSVMLLGHFKDASSVYLRQFPQWELIAVPRQADIDATCIRQIVFEAEQPDIALAALEEQVPLAVRQYMRAWMRLPHFAALAQEHRKVLEYKAAWQSAPYAPIFCTVDAVVKTAEHVLLIQRAGFPGRGLWALPGGFVEQDESLLMAALRELQEETCLGVLQNSLLDAFVKAQVFDHPDRSTRGRTITHAHFFDLNTAQLPQIVGSDDASAARWVPMAELAGMEEQFFEDHFHILDHFFALSREDVACWA